MANVLITGITGFVGSHLAEFLLERDYDIYGIARWRSRTEDIDHILDSVSLVDADIKDAHSLKTVIEKVEPQLIFHLAAQSFVPTSWKSPANTMETNVIGTLNLFEAVRSSNLDSRIHIAGSSEEYGLVYPDEVPVDEDQPLRPLSPYGVSKVATDLLGYQYFKSYGLKIIRTRGFNHTGPRRGEVFVSSNFAKQIAEIEKGSGDAAIRVGNLKAQRDFTDVRDMVRAYYLAIEKCEPGDVYNICSEKSVSIQNLLDILLDLSKKEIKVKEDLSRMRPSDAEILLGDCTKFRKRTGWKPTIPLEKTLEDLLDYWRERV